MSKEGKESISYDNFSLSSSNKSILVDTEEKYDIRLLEELNFSLDYDDADTRSCFVAGKKIFSLHNNPTLVSQILKQEQETLRKKITLDR